MYVREIEYRFADWDALIIEVTVRVLGPLGPVTFRKRIRVSGAGRILVKRPGDYVTVRLFDAESGGIIIIRGNITWAVRRHGGGNQYNNRWVTYNIPAIHVI